MRQFTVLYPIVVLSYDAVEQKACTVQADYFRIENGILTFRREARNGETYPEAVRVFNRDAWAEVIEGQRVAEPAVNGGRLNPEQNRQAQRMAGLDFDDHVRQGMDLDEVFGVK